MGLVIPWHVGSSRTRDQIRVPCIGRWILNHCTTREVPHFSDLSPQIFIYCPWIFFLSITFQSSFSMPFCSLWAIVFSYAWTICSYLLFDFYHWLQCNLLLPASLLSLFSWFPFFFPSFSPFPEFIIRSWHKPHLPSTLVECPKTDKCTSAATLRTQFLPSDVAFPLGLGAFN